MKYEVKVEMLNDGTFRSVCLDRFTGEIVRESQLYYDLHEALTEFANDQYRWFEELNVPNNVRDVWHVSVDISLW